MRPLQISTSRQKAVFGPARRFSHVVALIMAVLMLMVSGAHGQDRVRWSKDYIRAAGRLIASISATTNPFPYRAYLPYVSKNGAFSTTFVLQNLDTSIPASVNIRYYDVNGTQASLLTRQIGPLQTVLINPAAAGGGLDGFSSWQGSAVVASSTPVGAVIREYRGNTGQNGIQFCSDSYAAFADADASVTAMLPQVMKNIYSGPLGGRTFNSLIAIQNTSATAAARITLTYYDDTSAYTRAGIVIPPNATSLVSMPNELPTLSRFFGSAKIAADQPVVVLVNQYTENTLNVYTGYTQANAGTMLYAPQLLKYIYDSAQQGTFSSGMRIMTVDGSTATVSVTYTDTRTGRVFSGSYTAAPAANIDQRYDTVLAGESQFFGFGVITCSVPIVGLVNHMASYSNGSLRAATYRPPAEGKGSTALHFPFLAKNAADPLTGVTWSTAIVGSLMGNLPATVTVTYYYAGGSLTATASATPQNRMFQFDQRYHDVLATLDKLELRAVVTSTQPIGANVNLVGVGANLGDAAANYTAVK